MKAGDMVKWKWADGYAKGKVARVYHGQTSIRSKGKTIKRSGRDDDPALIIEGDNGSRILKLLHEVEKK